MPRALVVGSDAAIVRGLSTYVTEIQVQIGRQLRGTRFLAMVRWAGNSGLKAGQKAIAFVRNSVHEVFRTD